MKDIGILRQHGHHPPVGQIHFRAPEEKLHLIPLKMLSQITLFVIEKGVKHVVPFHYRQLRIPLRVQLIPDSKKGKEVKHGDIDLILNDLRRHLFRMRGALKFLHDLVLRRL